MNTFQRIDINIVAFIMLGIIFIMAVRRLDGKDVLHQSYFRIISKIDAKHLSRQVV